MTVSGRGFINIAWSAHGSVSRWIWIWLRNGYSGQHVDTLIRFLIGTWEVGTFSEQNYPQLTHTFQLAFENIFHKITQCLVKLLSICSSDDDWGHSHGRTGPVSIRGAEVNCPTIFSKSGFSRILHDFFFARIRLFPPRTPMDTAWKW